MDSGGEVTPLTLRKEIDMGSVYSSEYDINFTDASLKEVKAELAARERLRKDILSKINIRLRTIDSQRDKMPTALRKNIDSVLENYRDLDYESRHYGRAQMYAYIGGNIPMLMGRIILRLIKDLKIPASKERIREATDWAVLQLLYGAATDDKQLVDVAKEYGTDKSFWSKAKKSPIAEAYARFLRQSAERTKKLGVESPFGDALDKLPEGKLWVEGEYDEREKVLNDRGEDWMVAKKVCKERGLEAAVQFLTTGGATAASIKKFKAEMTHQK
jgi:hypothetical protein